MAAKNRNKARKFGFFKFTFLVLISLSLLFVGKKVLDSERPKELLDSFMNEVSKPSENNYTDLSFDEDISIEDAVYALSLEDSRVGKVYDNMEAYPEAVLELLVRNPEARDFVLDYPNHKDETEVGEISKGELKGGIPHFLQWDKRWGYYNYGSGVMGVTGCGPTCLSMVVAGLTGNKDASPANIAKFSEENGYYVDGAGSSWGLMKSGAASFGLISQEIPLSENSMAAELNAGRPLIINVSKGDFTTQGHFVVVTAYEDGMFIINDPNSPKLSSKKWSFDTLSTQIMNIWSYKVA